MSGRFCPRFFPARSLGHPEDEGEGIGPNRNSYFSRSTETDGARCRTGDLDLGWSGERS